MQNGKSKALDTETSNCIRNHSISESSAAYVLFDYRGLTDNEIKSLRIKLRETDSEFKIYKNTLTKRALESLNIDLNEHLNGPKAIAFGKDAIAPIKVLSDFCKRT